MKDIKKAFEALISSFKKSTAQSMADARELANLVIKQFEEHGDLSYAQTFLEAMPKNYIRRAAFLRWMSDHSPIKMDGDKLVKDKAPDAVEFRVAVAIATPFWDYAPDPEDVNFGSQEVIKAMKATISRFNKERMHPASARAVETVRLASEMVSKLEEDLSSYGNEPAIPAAEEKLAA